MDSPYGGVQWVGMDLHRRRSVLVRMAADGPVRVRCYGSELPAATWPTNSSPSARC
jgi:hypothetical protein